MHILVTNDDGPPSPHSSPYVLALVRELRRAGHFVSVCLPDSQRSWIGKAHLIGQSLRPLYYRPPSLNGAETFRTPSDDDVQDTGRVYKHPTRKGLAKKGGGGEDDAEEDWILIANGTPASCVQIALHHLFGHLPPIDLVLSGPNYGRNTSAAFALSSGTLGAALEAACCGRRAIALSFAFFSRNHDPDIIQAACRHAVRVVDAIWRQWPELPSSSSSASATSTTSADDGDGRLTRWRKMRNWSADPEEMAIPDLYSVNIPLVEGVEHRKTFWTNMLQNYWGIGRRGGSSTGGCFAVAEESDTEDGGFGSGSDADAAEMAEERAREGKGGEAEFAMAEAASGGQAGSAAEEEMRAKQHRHKHKRIHFKWAPQFGEVYKATEDAPPGNDGWTVKEGFTSVTPLKANFMHAATHLLGQEFTFSADVDGVSDDKGRTELAHTARREASLPNEVKGPRAVVTLQPRRPARKIEARPFNALVAYNDDYVQPLIVAAIEKHLAADSVRLIPTDGLDDLNKELHISSLQSAATSAAPATPLLLIVPYEAIPFGLIRSEAMSEQPTVFANSYCFRKALIRKHYLAATIEHWIAKRRQQQQQRQHAGNTNNGPPTILLESHVKRSEVFELDYAEFLDDALTECWDLRASLARNEEIEADDGTEGMCNKKKEWWILKPGMGDRGHGIRLFSTMRELEEIFEEWEADESDDEEEGDEMEVDDEDKERSEELGGEDITKHSLGHERDDNEQHDSAVGTSSPTGIRASHLRHFVAQPYLDPPFLLPTDRRKFHLRAYVLCVGGGGGGGGGVMQVYVFRKMLALFAATEYVSPDVDSQHLGGHLTNTCLQLEMLRGSTGEDREGRMEDRTKEKPLVNTFWNLPLPPSILEGVFDQICAVTGELFEAAATGGMAAHFEPLGNCFEVYGLDFLLTPSPDVADKEGEEGMAVVGAAVPHVWLLEVNSFPDFRQSGTGPGPKAVVADFWAAVVRRVARAFFDGQPVGSQGQEEEEAHCSDGVELQDGAQQSEEADQGIDGDDDGMRLVARVMLAKSGWGPRAGPAGSVSTED